MIDYEDLQYRSIGPAISGGAVTNYDTLIDQRPFYFSHSLVDPTNARRLMALSEYR